MRTRAVVAAAAGAVALAALALVAVPVVRHSDALNTEIRLAPDNPLPAETAPLPATVRPLWSASSGAAVTSVEGSTAVATSTHRVAGLDPATGRERWSYRRDNARLCGTTLRDGVVVALFARSHGCRELTGLDAATGARRWYRTIEITTDAVLTSGPGIAVATAADRMVAVDTGGGLNRWAWTADAGCRLDPAVAGPVAVATVARCGTEARLVLHDPYAEKAPWVGPQPAGSDPRVVAADGEVAVLDRTGGTATLAGWTTSLDKDGKLVGRRVGAVRDARLAYGPGAAAVTEGQLVVVWTGKAAVAVDTRARTVLWSAAATGPPTLAEGQVLFADGTGFTARPVATGTPVTRIPAGGEALGAAVLSRVGRLVVAATPGRLTSYG